MERVGVRILHNEIKQAQPGDSECVCGAGGRPLYGLSWSNLVTMR